MEGKSHPVSKLKITEPPSLLHQAKSVEPHLTSKMTETNQNTPELKNQDFGIFGALLKVNSV